jgi:hypothetical protein
MKSADISSRGARPVLTTRATSGVFLRYTDFCGAQAQNDLRVKEHALSWRIIAEAFMLLSAARLGDR